MKMITNKVFPSSYQRLKGKCIVGRNFVIFYAINHFQFLYLFTTLANLFLIVFATNFYLLCHNYVN